VNSTFGGLTTAIEIDGALASKYETGGLEYRIRSQGAFLIASDIALRDFGTLKSGEVYAMCYLFKKVR